MIGFLGYLWPFDETNGGDDVTSIAPSFRYSNYVESVLWMTIGVIVILWARRRGTVKRVHWILFVTLLIFGVSDLVEANTGAWWRPWWLLVWKGGCLVVFLCVLIVSRKQVRSRQAPVPSPGTPGEG